MLCDVSHFLSQQLLKYCEVCCVDHVCLLFFLELPLLLLLSQCCAWFQSCPSVPARGVDHRRSATMSNASLFCGTFEPTRMRWECGQVRDKKRKQLCRSVTVSSLSQSTRREKRERERVEKKVKEFAVGRNILCKKMFCENISHIIWFLIPIVNSYIDSWQVQVQKMWTISWNTILGPRCSRFSFLAASWCVCAVW